MTTAGDDPPIDSERVAAVQRRMPAAAGLRHLAETFSAMGDPTRLRLLFALSSEELCVYDLSVLLGVSVSAISHQLRLLRGLRLVKCRREGRLSYYSIDDPHIATMLDLGLRQVGSGASPGEGNAPAALSPLSTPQPR